MYTPQLNDRLVEKLYDEAKRQGIPMTTILNNIVGKAFVEIEVKDEERNCAHLQKRRTRCPDSPERKS